MDFEISEAPELIEELNECHSIRPIKKFLKSHFQIFRYGGKQTSCVRIQERYLNEINNYGAVYCYFSDKHHPLYIGSTGSNIVSRYQYHRTYNNDLISQTKYIGVSFYHANSPSWSLHHETYEFLLIYYFSPPFNKTVKYFGL